MIIWRATLASEENSFSEPGECPACLALSETPPFFPPPLLIGDYIYFLLNKLRLEEGGGEDKKLLPFLFNSFFFCLGWGSAFLRTLNKNNFYKLFCFIITKKNKLKCSNNKEKRGGGNIKAT